MLTNSFEELSIPQVIADPRPIFLLSINFVLSFVKLELVINSAVLSDELSLIIDKISI